MKPTNMHDRLQRFDSGNMFALLKEFPAQVREAHRIASRTDCGSLNRGAIQNVIVAGLGGSAIGGDILRDYLAPTMDVPVFVNRDYSLPAWVGESTLVFACSYSGNTEETLAAFDEAREKRAQVVCLTSGGELARAAADRGNVLINVPGGQPPRTALGYMFLPMLVTLEKLGLVEDLEAEIEETLGLLERQSGSFGEFDAENEALRLAGEIRDRLPIIYSAREFLEAVNMRWRAQMEENSKVLAYGNVLPEMNHNEIMGWERLPDVLERCAVIFLVSGDEHPQVRKRMSVTRELIEPYAGSVHSVHAEGESRLAKILGLISYGDWVSFYAAILNGVDPTPIAKIQALKASLK